MGTVWHELISDRIHLDVHMVPPSQDHPYYVMVTSGMSARPMTLPPDLEEPDEWRYAELCIVLPADWQLGEDAFKDDNNYWPVRLLKSTARIPHDFNSWLGYGHSIPNGQPAEPYAANAPFTGVVLIPPFAMPADFFALAGQPPLHIFQLLPVTDSEMQLKLDLGLEGMLDQIEKVDPELYGPLNINRPTC